MNFAGDFLCSECGKSFKDDYKLKLHTKIHVERIFKCPECPQICRNRCTLIEHMELHSNIKYNCNECGKVLNTKPSLRKHIGKMNLLYKFFLELIIHVDYVQMQFIEEKLSIGKRQDARFVHWKSHANA